MSQNTIINIITLNDEELEEVLEKSKNNSNIYFSYSIFPAEANDFDDNFEKRILKLLENEKFLGIGETGIDNVDGAIDINIQIKVFKEIIKIAIKYDLPINIHARNSLDDVIKILKTYEKLPKTILHCFDGDSNQLNTLIKMGIYTSFNGLITYNDRNKKLIQAIKDNPYPEYFVLETDAPYLTPGINRGKNNFPKYNSLVADRIAKELNINKYLLFEKMNMNACYIYNFKL